MTVVELVNKLKAGRHRADAIARIVGYVVMIQRLGWEGLPMNRTSVWKLEKSFKLLEIDPLTVEL
jgi:hypothetical protein